MSKWNGEMANRQRVKMDHTTRNKVDHMKEPLRTCSVYTLTRLSGKFPENGGEEEGREGRRGKDIK
jgi:hypothetical protein